MTTRLKRKLGDMGVDTHSQKATENFCLIGTPLPPLEKSKDLGEFIPLWKQDVRDEQGRRRLHGAFTGGFSAGYFNTVGSKEGWTPSTFVSSKNDRAKQKSARPEDFMDEEDLQDLKDNRKIVDSTDQMELAFRQEAHQENEDDDSMASALAATLSQPPQDSAGARVLKKMGWKFGQGIGPRVSWRQRRQQDLQAGVKTGPEEDDEEASKHTYASRDTPLMVVPRKMNSHGLGYTAGMSLDQDGGRKGGPNISSGFGLGALNEADEDDLDVYEAAGATSGRNRMAYDIAHGDDEDRIHVGGSKPKRPAASTSSQYLRDGKPVLAGFSLSDKPVAEDRWFPLPEVPPAWKPDPKRVWAKDANKEKAPVDPSRRQGGITADQRGELLGETPLPSAPRSVFEFMSKKDRERLESIAQAAKAGPSTAAAPPTPSVFIPPIDPHIAQSALLGFQPFSSNPPRHARYTAYLRSHLDPPTAPPLELMKSKAQTTDEFNRELDEYKKSAMLFKPVSGAMAGRFTSARIIDVQKNVVEGLHTPTFEPKKEEEEPTKDTNAVDTDPSANSAKMHAARSGMFGPMTREAVSWQPMRLLCKRFGVKDPSPTMPGDDPSSSSHPHSHSQTGTAAAAAASFSNPNQTANPADFLGGVSFANESSTFESASGVAASVTGKRAVGRKEVANIGLGDDEAQGKDILTYERPAMDIFKAIFASDDEDSDDEGDGVKKEEVKKEPQDVKMDEVFPSSDPLPPLAPEQTIPIPTPMPPTDEPVDMATFKPTFIPRESSKKKDGDREKKKSKKSAPTLSFGMGEDGDDQLEIKPSKDRPKKKRRKTDSEKEEKKRVKEKLEEYDDAMWVEKTVTPTVLDVPPVVVPLAVPSGAGEAVAPEEVAGPPRGRKRAVDFM